MAYAPALADIRFGCGLSPTIAPPADVTSLLAGLAGPDDMVETYPVAPFPEVLERFSMWKALSKTVRVESGTQAAKDADAQRQALKRDTKADTLTYLAAQVCRRISSTTPMRERLTWFWSDHFTTSGKLDVIGYGYAPYIDSAIRPYMFDKFEDLLISAVTHPFMVHYLDQKSSMGPNSVAAQKNAGRGLNENLAREIMELHTLGVKGPYTQDDVRELAELLTGLGMNDKKGLVFRRSWAEPGPETVLGIQYGSEKNAKLSDIHQVLRNLARHPVTADNISRKLAAHFVSDTPPPDLVAAISAAYLETDGDLMVCYEVLLSHPAAWTDKLKNVKPPLEFIGSSLRALAADPQAFMQLTGKDLQQILRKPMALMGHDWGNAQGPDGLDDSDSAWGNTPRGGGTAAMGHRSAANSGVSPS